MAIHDFTSQRLYVDHPLTAGALVPLAPEQANYLCNVLRLVAGSRLLVFNGREGEWHATLREAGKRKATLVIERIARPQSGGPDIDYLFAPLKRARLDYMVQKAVELGVARLRPVITRRTIAERVNLERMRANVIEAAEQCGVLRIPEVAAPERLDAVLDAWSHDRPLVLCDEEAEVASPLAALSTLSPGPVALLIGPEGGFAPEERSRLLLAPFTLAISLGPRIMRADTAAVAALALVEAVLGDWR